MEKRSINYKHYLIFILALAIFFRFYNFINLQYFSDDESLFFIIIRKMVTERRIVLISPNQATNLNLGSFFHILVLPLYLISKANPVFIGVFSSLLGVLTTYFIYKAGSLMKRQIGLLSSFIYATSFIISFFDRRFWQLTPNSFLSILAFFSLSKIIIEAKRSWIYPFFLVISTIFAWHSDLSLMIIPIFGFLAWLKFRFKILDKKNIAAFFLLIISFFPLIFFDLRHNYVNLKALNLILKKSENNYVKLDILPVINPSIFREALIRTIYTSSIDIQENFAYRAKYPVSPKLNLLRLILIIFSLTFLRQLYINKNREKKLLILLSLFLLAFVIGYCIYSIYYHNIFVLQYFTILFPIVCLIFGICLEYWLITKFKPVIYIFLLIFFIVNLRTLLYAKVKHPTYEKINAIKQAKNLISNKKFAAYDLDISGGGMHYLYLYNNLHPVKCNAYDAWFWIYMSHSLFDQTPQVNWPDDVLIFTNNQKNKIKIDKNILKAKENNNEIDIYLLDNKNQWVTKEKLESLITRE